MMQDAYRSKVRAIVYEAMLRLYDAGLVDQDTMQTFDELCVARAGDAGRPAQRRRRPAPLHNYYSATPAE